MRARDAGFTLVDLLVSLVIMSFVMAGVLGFFVAQGRNTLQQELTATLEANLRVAMEIVSSSLRNADQNVPPSMVPWVTNFNSNPSVTQGSGSNPDTISIASCTAQPVTTLSADAAKNSGSITLASTAAVNVTNRRLILIGGAHLARIDGPADPNGVLTSPTVTINPALNRAFPGTTPVCRIDVVTFSVNTTDRTLRIDENQGAGAQPAVDGVTNLQIDVNGTRYQITVTGQSERKDPETNAYLTRSLNALVATR